MKRKFLINNILFEGKDTMVMKKIITLIVVWILVATTFISIIHPIKNVEARPPDQEIPLDHQFIEQIGHELAKLYSDHGYWMGREFGSAGESAARQLLLDFWQNNINNNIEVEKIDEGYLDGVDNKYEFQHDYDFFLKVNGEEKAKNHYLPLPSLRPQYYYCSPLINYHLVITPDSWYIDYTNPAGYDLSEEIKSQQMSFSINFVPLNISGGVTGDVVYIKDYNQVSINETKGKIHLIELNQSESEDVFNDTINKINETGGIGFIIMTTNPAFLDKKDTVLPGVAISRQDGQRIVQSIESNKEVFVKIENNVLEINCKYEAEGILNKYIYLIDMKKFKMDSLSERINPSDATHDFLNFITDKAQKDHYAPVDAFLISSINDGTVDQRLNSALLVPDFRKFGSHLDMLVPTTFIPGFMIDGYLGGTLEDGDVINFYMNPKINLNVESYNVIGTISGETNDVIIIGGHYDSFWGEYAIDDGLGPAILWGIAKYFKDNQITPKYTLKFIAFTGEEPIDRGSFFYVRKHLVVNKDENVLAYIGVDTIAMKKQFDWDVPFTPWIYPGLDTDETEYWNILNVIRRTNYTQATGHPFREPHLYGRDRCPYGISDSDAFANLDDPKDIEAHPLVNYLVEIERFVYEDEFPDDPWYGDMWAYFWHETRSNPNEINGDVWDHVDLNDLHYTSNISLNVTKYFALYADLNFNNECSFSEQDIDNNGYNDSVKISFDMTTDISTWGNVESVIYLNGVTKIKTFETDLFTLIQNQSTPGELIVTLPPNATAGNYEIRVYLKDCHGNEADFDNTTLYLYPYSEPIADFDWERNENNKKMINFTDQSLPSPGEVLVSWNWSFGDNNYSNNQNCSHNYSSVGLYNVTLMVTDSANKTANVSKQIQTFNSPPVASFTESSKLVVTNETISFESESFDVDGNIINTSWYCGDNTTIYGENIEHSYNKSGFYTISLKVTDNDNKSTLITKSETILVVDAMVDDDFTDNQSAHEWNTIAKGLNDVGNGGIIYVFNGSYNPFEINKSIALYGESRGNVRISGGNPGVKIRYHNVSLSGFNISSGTNGIDVNVKYGANQTSNVAIENCNIYGNSNIGILLNQSKDCSIENCTIKGSNIGVKIINNSSYNVIKKCTISYGTYGVYVSNSSHNFIGSPSITNPYLTDCTFTYNHNSIYLKNADHNFILGCDIDGTPSSGGTSAPTKGIYLNDSENNTISTCYIHESTGKGVYLNDSTWNKVEFCKIIENPNGVYLFNSPGNLIAQNHFGINSEFGVYVPSNSQNNHVYYNDFFVNGNGQTNQSFDANGRKGAENLWSKSGNRTLTKSGRGEGNFWSDYNGNDNNQDGIGDTPYQINSSGVERNDSYPVMDPYGWCNFTQDSTLPVITNVSNVPSTVGFGYTVAIRAMVTDNSSNISTVKVNIIYPDQFTGNYTMDCIGGSWYQYTFTNTWIVGQYNYTIWAMDETYNRNSSGGHHFNVSAQATISIATLKDSYGANQYINITDPPNPLENYTLVGRGLTWDRYYNTTSGCNVLEVSAGPVNYQEDNGTWTPINNSLLQLTSDHPAYNYGYRTGNDRGLFGVYFKPNAQNDWPVAFTYNKSDDPTIHVVRSKLVGVGYLDPASNWAYHYLQNVQSSQGQTNGNSVTYADVFTGTDITWSYGNTELKEAITLSNATKTVLQNHPPSLYGLNNGSSYLVFITKLDHQNLDMYNASGMLTGNVTISDAGVEFKDALGQFKCALPLGEAYELNNESVRQKLTYRIVHLNGNTYLLSGLKVSDLNVMTFPVVIDPTLTVESLSNDGYIYSSSTTYSTVWSASSGTVDSSGIYLSIGQKKVSGFPTSTYYVYRGFVLFNTSSLPSNAYLDSAKLSLYKKDDYSTTDFLLTIQNGQPIYPHNPLQAGDYAKSHYSGNGGSLNTTNFVNGRNNITLNNLGWINRNGITKLCLRSSRDINGTAPTGNEYVNVYSANAPLVGYVPKLIITYRNQSKIKNTGFMDIKGYLLIQIQYYNTSQSKWLVENDTVNETSARAINAGQQLALDTIFDGHVRTNDLTHSGSNYRVYAAFRDPSHKILKTNDGKELAAWWQFTVLGIT